MEQHKEQPSFVEDTSVFAELALCTRVAVVDCSSVCKLESGLGWKPRSLEEVDDLDDHLHGGLSQVAHEASEKERGVDQRQHFVGVTAY